jgi:hypothetical protein
MLAVSHKNVQRSIQRFLVCALMLTGLALTAPATRAAEIIPSLGMTRTPESGDKTNLSYGLAVRAHRWRRWSRPRSAWATAPTPCSTAWWSPRSGR